VETIVAAVNVMANNMEHSRRDRSDKRAMEMVEAVTATAVDTKSLTHMVAEVQAEQADLVTENSKVQNQVRAATDTVMPTVIRVSNKQTISLNN
jgi:hypothetical protein